MIKMMNRVSFLSSLIMVTVSCGPSATTTRTAVTHAANASIATAVKIYKGEQVSCVERAETRLQAETCIKQVQKTWEPVWTSWDKLRDAEDVERAYCELVKSFPKDVQPMPVDGVMCLGQ